MGVVIQYSGALLSGPAKQWNANGTRSPTSRIMYNILFEDDNHGEGCGGVTNSGTRSKERLHDMT